MSRWSNTSPLVLVRGSNPFAKAELAYMHNLLVSTSLRQLEKDDIKTLEELENFLGHVEKAVGRPVPELRDVDTEDLVPRQRQQVRARLRAWIRRHKGPVRVPAIAQPVRRNLDLVTATLGIDAPSVAVLTLLLAVRLCPELHTAVKHFGDLTLNAAASLVAAATSLPVARVRACVERKSRLVTTGLVWLDDDPEDLPTKLRVHDQLLDLVQHPRLTARRLLQAFVDTAEPPTLDWDDYAHVDGALRAARDLLGAAVQQKAAGVNVLFYGPTGTGKTEAARLLATTLRVTLHVAGKGAGESRASAGMERFGALRIASRFASPKRFWFESDRPSSGRRCRRGALRRS